MEVPFFPKESRWHKVARQLHLTEPKTTSQKIINTSLHLLLYFALILFGYFLGLLQFAL